MEKALQKSIELAHRAGAIALRYFRSAALAVDHKADGTVVTQADREIEQFLRGAIAAEWPDDAFLGEEFGEHQGRSGRRWIVDPIDGTLSFAHGVPLFGVLIGCEVDGRAELGVVFLPALGETIYAVRGCGAHWMKSADEPPIPARVSSVNSLDQALFCATSLRGFQRAGCEREYSLLNQATGRQRGWGDCYGHMLVATGRAEIMVDPILSIWDATALLPIVLEAGGCAFDRKGEVTHGGVHGLITTNGSLAEPVRALFRAPA